MLDIKRPNEVFVTTDYCGRLMINDENIVTEYKNTSMLKSKCIMTNLKVFVILASEY